MRQPVGIQSNKAQQITLPAPIGGWNARDDISQIPPNQALTLENWFPGEQAVTTRPGYASFATITGTAETLVSYNYETAQDLLVCHNGEISDITDGSTTSLASGFSNNRWFWVNFRGYALMFNGADTPQKYDGSTVSTNTITGVTATNLKYPWIFKSRLFIAEKDSASFWYLATNNIAGSASELDFSSLAEGKAIAGATWTRDGGSGMDDYCVFLMSEGDLLVYQGDNPASASDWALVGKYKVGKPMGDRPFAKLGGDLLVITVDGVVPMSAVLASDRFNPQAAVTDIISGAWKTSAKRYKESTGWEITLFPLGQMGIVNIPNGSGSFVQYVVNTTTRAWACFKNIPSNTWGLHKDQMYFGSTGAVYKFDSGTSNAGSPITAIYGGPFLNHQPVGMNKGYKLMRPLLSSPGAIPVYIGFDTDYTTKTSYYEPTQVESGGGGVWDEAEWDVAEWAGAQAPQQEWRTILGVGISGAARFKTITSLNQVSFHGVDLKYVVGNGL